MNLPSVFSATLGLTPPWQVSDVTFADDDRRLDITVTYGAGTACPCCGAREPADEAEVETWYHHDFFRYTTYLHSRVPGCACCGHRHAVERPWARAGSKFERLLPAAPDG
jgi:transposase